MKSNYINLLNSEKREMFKAKIRENCTKCKNAPMACVTCCQNMVRLEKFNSSNVPVVYWQLNIETLSSNNAFKDFLIGWKEKINENISSGQNICIAGGIGRGKTFGATFIMKQAIENNISCWYDTMFSIKQKMTMDHEYASYLGSVDLLVIDEFDSRFVPKSEDAINFLASNIECLLRDRFHNMKSTIICTNEEDGKYYKGFIGIFYDVFESLNNQYVKTFFLGGKDLRNGRI